MTLHTFYRPHLTTAALAAASLCAALQHSPANAAAVNNVQFIKGITLDGAANLRLALPAPRIAAHSGASNCGF